MATATAAALALSTPANGGGVNTVGLISSTPDASPGYTLFTCLVYNDAYLVDVEGQIVHSWRSPYAFSLAPYLKENGNMLKYSLRAPMQEFDWDGNLLWEYHYESASVTMHHDIAILPNGNILVIADETKSNAEAIATGRKPIFSSAVEALHVVELMPVGSNSATIVWEWHIWDHLIQDFDTNQAHFGVVADHPERVDINFGELNYQDWLHANSIDYNESYDQIILSIRTFSEFWVIDHSTTTAEAAGHTGGNSGKGGDLLYRWGNPLAYDRGAQADQKLFKQHDAQWIPQGKPGAGNILVFNNGAGRPSVHSSVEEIAPPVDGNGWYTNPLPGAAFGPAAPVWSYTATPPGSLFSFTLSGADRQPNGNTLICDGDAGTFLEVTMNGELVWHYVSPVNGSGPMPQGSHLVESSTFRADRYPPDFPAFAGRDLTPNGTLEWDASDAFQFQQVGRTASEVNLSWASLPESTYQVQYALSLETPGWTTISTQTAIGTRTHFTDTDPLRINQAVSCYRVLESP
jgi:hypothetical protein